MNAAMIVINIVVIILGINVVLFTVAIIFNRLFPAEIRLRYNPLWILPAVIYEFILICIYVVVFFFGFITLKRKYPSSRKPPTILVHGYGINKLCFAYLYLRLKSTGDTEVIPINIGPLFKSIEEQAQNLSHKIDTILTATNAEKVNIVAHSQGGLISRYYLQFLKGSEKTDKLVTIGTPHHGTMIAYLGIGKNAYEMRPESHFLKRLNANPDLGATALLSIYSPTDTFLLPAHSSVPPLGDSFITVPLGHMSLLFSPRVLRAIKTFLGPPADYTHGRRGNASSPGEKILTEQK